MQIAGKYSIAQNATAIPIRVAGYVAIVHPVVTLSSSAPVYNFSKSYTVGFPIGINFWKSRNIGFSLEIVPFINADKVTSKTSNVLIHPGILVALGHGFTFAGRIAFETAGRYGFTPVLNKIIKKNAGSNFFVALPLPFRFGNNKPASFTPGIELGFGF
jgi:hypothetical protein